MTTLLDLGAETTKLTKLADQAMNQTTDGGRFDAVDILQNEVQKLSSDQLKQLSDSMHKQFVDATAASSGSVDSLTALGHLPEMILLDSLDGPEPIKGVTFFEHNPYDHELKLHSSDIYVRHGK